MHAKIGIVAVKVQVPRKGLLVRMFTHPVGKTLIAVFVLAANSILSVSAYYYLKYSKLIESKLAAGPFANTSMLFAAPRSVALGDPVIPAGTERGSSTRGLQRGGHK